MAQCTGGSKLNEEEHIECSVEIENKTTEVMSITGIKSAWPIDYQVTT